MTGDRFPVCRSSVGRLCYYSRSTQYNVSMYSMPTLSFWVGSPHCLFRKFANGKYRMRFNDKLCSIPGIQAPRGIASTGTPLGSNLLRLTYNNYISINEVTGFMRRSLVVFVDFKLSIVDTPDTHIVSGSRCFSESHVDPTPCAPPFAYFPSTFQRPMALQYQIFREASFQ